MEKIYLSILRSARSLASQCCDESTAVHNAHVWRNQEATRIRLIKAWIAHIGDARDKLVCIRRSGKQLWLSDSYMQRTVPVPQLHVMTLQLDIFYFILFLFFFFFCLCCFCRASCRAADVWQFSGRSTGHRSSNSEVLVCYIFYTIFL